MKIKRFHKTWEAGIFLSLIVLIAVILLSGREPREAFLSLSNVQNLSRQIAFLTVFALGETFVIIAGGIDLSIGSVIGFTGVLVAWLMEVAGIPMWVSIMMVMGLSASIGLYHGFLVTRIGLPPFVVTLGSMLIFRSMAKVINHSIPISVTSDSFNFLANGRVLGIPMPVYFAFFALCITVFLLHYTIYGRYIYAVGGNEKSAWLSGVSVGRIKMLTYVVSTTLAAFAGILFASYIRMGDPKTGMNQELYAIAAAVIGGTNLMGGVGTLVGTLLGASVFRVVLNGLNLVIKKDSSLWEGGIVGTVLILALLFNSLRAMKKR